jgi:hypothetical protein
MQHSSIGLHTFILVAAILLFFAAGISWWAAEPWPWRLRLISLGLFCWALSTVISF